MQPVLRPLIAVLFAASGLVSVAQAQSSASVCDGVQQDRAACLRERGAARQEAGRNGLTTAAPGAEQQNALDRCKSQPAAARAECEARISGGGAGKTTVEGSVMGGGVIRETVTPIPATKP